MILPEGRIIVASVFEESLNSSTVSTNHLLFFPSPSPCLSLDTCPSHNLVSALVFTGRMQADHGKAEV